MFSILLMGFLVSYLKMIFMCWPNYPSLNCSKLVLLVGTELQHVVAQLALEVVEATATNVGTQLKLRDDLFWFGKPRVLWWLIQFISFQVISPTIVDIVLLYALNMFHILTFNLAFRMPLRWPHSYGLW